MGAPKTVDVVEKAIENGSTVLIENMAESIDAALMSVVTRSIVKKGRKMSIKMGDKILEYNPNFKLFLHTKMSNPHYPPEIQAETTIITDRIKRLGAQR